MLQQAEGRDVMLACNILAQTTCGPTSALSLLCASVPCSTHPEPLLLPVQQKIQKKMKDDRVPCHSGDSQGLAVGDSSQVCPASDNDVPSAEQPSLSGMGCLPT